MRKVFLRRIGGLTGACVALVLVCATTAQARKTEEERIQEASDLATGLMRWGLADYAKEVMGDVQMVSGQAAKDRVRIFNVRAHILSSEFDKAEQLLQQMDKSQFASWGAILEAADAYLSHGMWEKTQYWYDLFFTTFPTPPSMKDAEYKSIAYRYTQILMRFMKLPEKAYKVYEYALNARPVKEEQLQMWAEMAAIALKVATQSEGTKQQEWIGKANQRAQDLQWRSQGTIWFGKSVVVLAHLQALTGDRPGAMQLIQGYLPQLMEVHELLQESGDPELMRLTPMAEVRYLLAKLYYEEGIALIEGGQKKAGLKYLSEAIQHSFNVFARYPTTMWAPQAGKLSEQIFDTFDDYNIEYKRPPGHHLVDVMNIQLREAGMMMRGHDYENAIDRYLQVLSLFPEETASVRALGDLARCYLESDMEMEGEAVYGYIVERFRSRKKLSERAGDALLVLASARSEVNDNVAAGKIYDAIVEHFPDHPNRPVVLLHRGVAFHRDGLIDDAMDYYKKLKPTDEGYDEALSRMAAVYRQKKEFKKEVRALTAYIKAVKPGHKKARAQYRLASAIADMGRPAVALKAFKSAIKALEAKANNPTPNDSAKNKELLGPAVYKLAAIYSALKEPEEDKEKNQKMAIRLFNKFATENPSSEVTPSALLRMAILQSVVGDNEGATDTFDRIGSMYPDSDEAKRMHFLRIRALVDMNYIPDAKRSVSRMLENASNYSGRQFMAIGGLMAGHDEKLTVKCYEQAMSMVQDPEKERWIIEGGLYALGDFHFKERRYDDAVMSFKELFDKYPRTGYTTNVAFKQAYAYAEIMSSESDKAKRKELFNESILALKRVAKLCIGAQRKPWMAALSARVSLESANVYEKRAQAEDAYGADSKAEDMRGQANAAYYRLFVFNDVNIAGVGRYMDDAFFKLIPYEKTAERWDKIVEYCSRYIEEFDEASNKSKYHGRYRDQAEAWLADAQAKVAAGPAPKVAADEAIEETGEEAEEEAPAEPAEPTEESQPEGTE